MPEHCARCNATTVTVVEVTEPLVYGVDVTHTLQVTVPVLTCTTCRFEWTDYRAEAIQDASVARHRQLRRLWVYTGDLVKATQHPITSREELEVFGDLVALKSMVERALLKFTKGQ